MGKATLFFAQITNLTIKFLSLWSVSAYHDNGFLT